ncbi:diadenylate cyclase CdaA [Paludicola sp. MB14-C6]|uniref:diadenylate cyclase CdaA n=1 Tax=Paludihabitans sp. MB14-C6 TaxID=3070656 RepID=UPI0027DC27A1|nr:diadenylate cyclase CdaA [Paludicola sp. MB14-C6]WMJ23372.1 diadenylate cyclase CdaA [Paludicola sp. MB14-C6]
MIELQNFFIDLGGIVKSFGILDFIDIALIAYLIYKAINLVKETRAEQLVKGILLLAFSYFIAKVFQLKTMSFLLKNVLNIGVIALIVLFQPELRRVLEKVGRTKVADLNVFSGDNPEKQITTWKHVIEILCNGVANLSASKTGALIVIERKTKLGEQIDTGVIINATVSEELLGNLFFVNSPLHDGALIIRDGRLLAAACFLPKPQKENLIASHLGSRHRAAIGISEISDAITIVVSEETGTVSVTLDGQLTRNYTKESLSQFLMDKLIPTNANEESKKSKKFWRVKKNEKRI